MACDTKKITIDGVEFVRADSMVPAVPIPSGKRAVIVIDQGWIAAGDVEDKNGRIKLSRAVLVWRWEEIGFDGMIANPKHKKVFIKPLPNGFDIPAGAELFRVPVVDDWGL